ncbi:hypothetical protein COW36_21910 [bacterium (Candidatus Blackallbacteria) CG17_big_fil_post_rev_8_21_14_2_50_48_46]|uniref:Uncharacterized protein n=1 Tax=bacterium (Candidatus Blackallbacteria) CG17_big_fil_post_rev_8_21_14_2_50_48_46 TaxID=2014261 RepID=A0A2M7FY52_9BACT|nr:MAG: hypothetical protein COW64_13340 [bacterium (Candidatus Blackallbacteria) CG18_big_fil_WC_8_21_14_2_50_49_26]PIW14274.1 MAG: hypothetical protein COW36_21910 [bacterium (Candidatus Blackallbacteria) CG17_big_fil_post_rev_8_21_14_2_50_48_46]PIW45543.1 MAG: hypothetical protein COW20_19515 [bacterium (Candidatus Blackallbacteria) CG13_big_fil_rev_8_21_14_2_50_49_14]
MHPLWPELLEYLVLKSAPECRDFLKTWGETERKTCFKLHKADFNSLRKTCHYSEDSYLLISGSHAFGWNSQAKPRFSSVKKEASVLKAHAAELSDYIQAEKINFYAAEDAYALALNLETVWAALCDQRSALGIAKNLRKAPAMPYHLWEQEKNPLQLNGPEPGILAVSLALSERPESWALEALQKLFAEYQENYPGIGFYASVSKLIALHPAWETELRDALGKSLFIELHRFHDHLNQIPLPHLLIGLSWRNLASAGPLKGHSFPPYLNTEILGKFLAEKLPASTEELKHLRSDLVDLILQRLLENTRKEENREWLKLYEVLKLLPQEKQARLETWLQLLQASSSNAIQLALKEFKNPELFKQAPEYLPELLIPQLSHPVQKIAKESLNLLKKWLKAFPENESALTPSLRLQLLSPHAVVRQELLKELQEKALSSESRAELEALYASGLVGPLEAEALTQLLKKEPRATTQVKTEHASVAERLAACFPAKPSHQGLWSEDPLLPIPNSPEDLSACFLKHCQTVPNDTQLECMAQAILNQPLPPEPERLKRQMKPVFAELESLLKPQHEHKFQNPQRVLLALLLQAWLEPTQISKIPEQVWQSLDLYQSPFRLELRETLRARQAALPFRLSQPEYLTGWIRLPSFLQRLEKIPPSCLSDTMLSKSLARLTPDGHEAHWEKLKTQMPKLPESWPQILTLALGPEEEALLLIKLFQKKWLHQPPDDILLEQQFSPSPRPRKDSTENLELRRFMLALHVRRRAERLSPALLTELKTLPLHHLRLDLGLDFSGNLLESTLSSSETDNLLDTLWGGLSQVWSQFTTKASEHEPSDTPLEDLASPLQNQLKHLMQPFSEYSHLYLSLSKLTSELRAELLAVLWGQPQWEKLQTLKLPGQTRNFEFSHQNWPQLWPLAICLNPHYRNLWESLNPDIHLYPRLRLCPDMAESLFEVATLKLRWKQGEFGGISQEAYSRLRQDLWKNKREELKSSELPDLNEVILPLDKHDFLLLLLQAGHLPRIPLAPALKSLAWLLSQKHPQQRQPAIDLIWAGLEDGRLQSEAVAQAIAQGGCRQSKGLNYLLDALQIFELKGEKGLLLNLRILECCFANTEIPTKNLSALLELAFKLLPLAGNPCLAEASLAGLKQLAQAPKKTVCRDKAQVLLKTLKTQT